MLCAMEPSAFRAMDPLLSSYISILGDIRLWVGVP